MSPTDRPTKAQRREEARQEAVRLRQEQERAAKRKRTIAISAVAALLVGFAVLVVVILSQGGEDTPAAEQVQPSFAADGGGGVAMDADGIMTAPADADSEWPIGAVDDDVVVVTVYSDPICPWCAVFEQVAMPVLEELRLAGEVVIDHRWLNALDGYSLDARYSTRASQALYTVAEEAPDQFLAFTDALMAGQPAENTEGLTDDQIAEIARGAGVPDDVVAAIGEGRFTWWVDQVTEAARETYDGRISTPSIRVNGEPLAEDVDWRVEADLRRSIEDARG